MLQEILPYFNQGFGKHHNSLFLRRQDVGDNEIEIDEIEGLKPPPFQRQETEEHSSSESDEDSNGDDGNGNDAAEESAEDGNGNNGSERASEQEGNDSDSNGDDYSDEPPGGDGQGGGVLGFLAGLSGGVSTYLFGIKFKMYS